MSNNQFRSQYWMFTINNPPSNDVPGTWADTEYVVWQREKGVNGTEHLQGYAIFSDKKRLTAMKKINAAAHWEARKGNHAQAKDYCTKADTRVDGPWETGAEPVDKEQGKRNDLLTLKRRLDEGATEKQIAEDPTTFPVWARHHKIVARYRTLSGKQRDWPTFTTVIWGAPGLGKTRKARAIAPADAYWLSRPAGTTCWFDGYMGQETVVIDEFYGWISLDLLCRLLDRYPLQVETKGGSTPFVARNVIITSNVPPEQWYKLPIQRMSALFRRLRMPLGLVEHMVDVYVPPGEPVPPPPLPRVEPDSLLCDEALDLFNLEMDSDPANALVDRQLHQEPPAPYDPFELLEVPFYGAQR